GSGLCAIGTRKRTKLLGMGFAIFPAKLVREALTKTVRRASCANRLKGRKPGYKDLNTMARVSVESAKAVITTLLSEQERDRDSLQRMLSHSQKMTEALLVMRDQEEHRIDTEAAERKAALRRRFGQL